jgi:hypothetical protein
MSEIMSNLRRFYRSRTHTSDIHYEVWLYPGEQIGLYDQLVANDVYEADALRRGPYDYIVAVENGVMRPLTRRELRKIYHC